MATIAVENYLKAVLQLSLRKQAEWIATGELAEAMRVLDHFYSAYAQPQAA